MFRFNKPSAAEIDAAITKAASLPDTGAEWFGSMGKLKEPRVRFGYAHDFASLQIGAGEAVFAAARNALAEWRQFDLGWVRVANANVTIGSGQIVAVEVQTLGLWSVNLSRIVQVIDTPTRFGFVYATTMLHVEQGQECFLLDFDLQTKSVMYRLEAVSRPRNTLAKLAYPFTRAMQHRFARESLMRMRDVVEGL